MLRHDRTLVAGLVLVPLACWAWIVWMARDMYGPMTGPSAWMMTAVWDGTHLLLLCAMWTVMMIGMMLPSVSPMLLLYARAARGRTDGVASGRRVYALAAGYLLVWAGFSVVATALQRGLSELLLLSPMMTLASPLASGALLAAAGVYQLTPWKRTCLDACRSPLAFITQHWRPGAGGAFHMGVEHGAYCVGCCWGLMLLLFAGGVMNLYVIAALTTIVLAEKLAPAPAQYGRVSGLLLVALGVWVAVR